ANVIVSDDGEPWLTGFAFSEIAASDALLDADVAQFLAALAVVVGAARAVASAIGSLGREAVGKSLPRLQRNALTGPTRDALKAGPGLLEESQDTVARECDVSEPDFVALERISRQRIFTVAMLVAVTYFLLPQVANLPGVVREIGRANWAWVPLVL